ncbi:hypothetical protein [Streptomyces sp. NBC_00358]|jgi:hypothetical protein|uniref:hypothetical protein n=1 Tax=Streptomyces sp. NBC_00358 TaxID=2975725 RepID=UPI002E26DD2B
MSALLLSGVALAGTVVASSPAQASTRTCTATIVQYDICFDGSNDAFYVSDTVADGRRAVASWKAYDGSGRSGECHDSDGALNGATVCDYDFKEGVNNYITFMGSTRNGANGADDDLSLLIIAYVTPR